MKWYAYDEDATTYTMILDHNTTAVTAWNESGNNNGGPVKVNEQLYHDTAEWDSSLNPRLITANEIITITRKTGWTNSKSNWYNFESLAATYPTTWPTIAKYGWLFDRAGLSCTQYGCLNNATETDHFQGYWTSSPIADDFSMAWSVTNSGELYVGGVDTAIYFGVRPVITIQKSLLNELD